MKNFINFLSLNQKIYLGFIITCIIVFILFPTISTVVSLFLVSRILQYVEKYYDKKEELKFVQFHNKGTNIQKMYQKFKI